MATRIANAVKWLAGQRPGHFGVVGTDRLVRNWTFRPSRPDHISAIRRIGLRKNAEPAPESVAVKRAFPSKRWSIYFIYSPDGHLTPAHRFTLRRLSSSSARLLVVFASSTHDNLPAELLSIADALYWKALPGFDFSGYVIGLDELATHSPGADIFVMNDSVYGPFCEMDDLWPVMSWDFTGFTASSGVENHLQSYAFLMKNWNGRKRADLDGVLDSKRCFNTYEDVVFCQETRLARIAARSMTVGALWYADHRRCADAPVQAALALARNGFPFLKKSLLTKHAHVNDEHAIRSILTDNGHPSP